MDWSEEENMVIILLLCFNFVAHLPYYAGSSEMDMGLGGPQFGQQQGPTNPSTSWPEGVLQMEQVPSGNQSRLVCGGNKIGWAACFRLL